MDKNRAMVSFVAIRKFDRHAALNQVFRLNRHRLVNFLTSRYLGKISRSALTRPLMENPP
jgi:hypothetical protein